MADIKIKRQSPVCFSATPEKTEMRDFWEVVLAYKNEKSVKDKTKNNYVVDLSHFTRWDVQGKSIDRQKSIRTKIPKIPGTSVLSGNILINRMNRIQASVWHFVKKVPKFPKEMLYTDTTEATMAVALIGNDTFSIAEKVSALDFLNPKNKTPFLLQGPFCHIPCQIVVFANGILLTCSRGYGSEFIHALMEAGEEFGLQPAGENRFLDWLKKQ